MKLLKLALCSILALIFLSCAHLPTLPTGEPGLFAFQKRGDRVALWRCPHSSPDCLVVDPGATRAVELGQFKAHVELSMRADRIVNGQEFDRERAKISGYAQFVQLAPEQRAPLEAKFAAIDAQRHAETDLNRLVASWTEKLFRDESVHVLTEKDPTTLALVVRSYLEPEITALSFTKVKHGTFLMGSRRDENGRSRNEALHKVTLTKDFEIGTTPVTQRQWFSVMAENPAFFSRVERCPKTFVKLNGVGVCPDFPVEVVSWNEVQIFLNKINSQDSRYDYRLPTEAEWEYAARAGTQTAYSFGDEEGVIDAYAWYWSNSHDQTHEVASKKPNPWGLFDMHGNVFEWVQDWYTDEPYAENSSVTDPLGPASGTLKVRRGGCWYYHARGLRSAARSLEDPSARDIDYGFRLVRVEKDARALVH